MLTAKMHSLKDKLAEQAEEEARLEVEEAKAKLAEESKKSKLNKPKRAKEKT